MSPLSSASPQPSDALPIDALLPQAVESLARHRSLVVVAPPGSGKTTHLPWSLLQAPGAPEGQVLVLEPRRLAARLAAQRVASERGDAPGEQVGWQVRFDTCVGPRTRLVYMTEGVLGRRLLAEPDLRSVSAVVVDEFHERHLPGDLALAWLRHLARTTRPDLRLVVMSATMDASAVARYLDDAPILASDGRLHPVAVEYAPPAPGRSLEASVAAAVRRLLDEGLDGDVLVFLPGAAEIRRAAEACEGLAGLHDLEIAPLHGDLPLDAQERAVRRGRRRKLILSTNVAESSVTVEGVVAVIDSGLARVMHHSAWSGLPMTRIQPVSRASVDQRAGRAGRLRPGRCIRLFSRQDHDLRPAHDLAEIHRADLAETLLHLKGAGLRGFEALEWLELPPAAAVDAALVLLRRLGALDATADLTPTGREMLGLPVHPRLARLLVEARRTGISRDGALAAAILGERDVLRPSPVGGPRGGRTSHGPGVHATSDVGYRVERLVSAPHGHRGGRGTRSDGSSAEVDAGAVQAVERVARQLQAMLAGGTLSQGAHARDAEDALEQALLVAWPDRLARCRRDGRQVDLVLAQGGSARLADDSVVREADLVVVLNVEQREGRGGPLARMVSRVKVDWILDRFIDEVRETTELSWNEEAERVEAVTRLLYDGLVLDESAISRVQAHEAFGILRQAVRRAGIQGLAPDSDLEGLRARLAFVEKHCPEVGLHPWSDEDVEAVLDALCEGKTTMAEVRRSASGGGLREALLARLEPRQRSLLGRLAPDVVSLPRRKSVRVHYVEGQAPWIASRLQDFLGLRETPTIAEGRVPLVLHLLAPNQRPVQVTADLAGFWTRTYPSVRRELCRRYPRHPWPEDPLQGS